MAIRMLKKDAADIATPASGKVTLFIDSADGQPKVKDESGTTSSLQGIQGDPGADGTDGSDGTNGQGVPTGGTAGQVLSKIDGTDYNTEWVDASGGGGTTLPTTWGTYLAASLEPDAIETMQKDSFSYSINSSTTKLLLNSWQTRIGSTGRMENRNPAKFMPLRGVTLNGTASGSLGVFVDPSLPTYSDAWSTYYTRLADLAQMQTRYLGFSGASARAPFLPGPYGAIITHITCFDLAWLVLITADTYGQNLWDEISDSSTQRIGDPLTYAVSKINGGEILTSSSGTGTGAVCYAILPSTWSECADPLAPSGGTYTFQDDFMGTALDTTTVWTRAQSTTGNVEIDTNYQWCKLAGNSSWGSNGLRRQTSTTRASGVKLVWDVYVPQGVSGSGSFVVGWSDGSAHSQAAMAHGVNFAGAGIINVYENGTNRGTVGSGWTAGGIYRIRITLSGASAAVYEIQGGKEYPAIGSASWTTITPGTSSSATSTLYVAGAAWAGNGYVSHPRVYT